MNEEQTRVDLIDPAMIRAGWKVGEGPEFSAWSEYKITFPEGSTPAHNYVDYCLMHDGKVYAVCRFPSIQNLLEPHTIPFDETPVASLA